MDFQVTLGERFWLARRRSGLTGAEAAKLYEVKPWTITEWERDRGDPPRDLSPMVLDHLMSGDACERECINSRCEGVEPTCPLFNLEKAPTPLERAVIARRRAGLSQDQLARRLRVTKQTLIKWERVWPDGTPGHVLGAARLIQYWERRGWPTARGKAAGALPA